MQVGTTLDGRFALLSRADYDLPGVERFLARDMRLGSNVVVDEISSVAPTAVRRAALSTLAVRDPRLTRTIATSASGGATYVVAERAEGICLATILGKRRLHEDLARAVVGEAARALAAASAGAAHHGWLRAESVFVDDRGRVSITGLAVDGELALQAGLRRGRGEGADATALARIFLAAVTGTRATAATDADLPDLAPASRALCDDAIAGKSVPSLAHILDALGPFDARSLRSLPHTWESLPLSLAAERDRDRERKRARAAAAREVLARTPPAPAAQTERSTIERVAAVIADPMPVAAPTVPEPERPLTAAEIEDLHDLYTFDAMVEEQTAARGPTTQELFYERLHGRWPRSRSITRRLDRAHERAIRGGPINATPIMLGLSIVAIVALTIIAISLFTNTPSTSTPGLEQRLDHYPEFTYAP